MSSWGAQPPAVSCREVGDGQIPFELPLYGQVAWRETCKEVTRILITPWQDEPTPALTEVLPAVSVTDCQPMSCLNSQLHRLHPLCLEVPLQFWAGGVYFGWVHVFAVQQTVKEECLLQQGGICISAGMTKTKRISTGLWKKESAQEMTVRIAYGCGLGMAFLNREVKATLSWEMSQKQQRKPF